MPRPSPLLACVVALALVACSHTRALAGRKLLCGGFFESVCKQVEKRTPNTPFDIKTWQSSAEEAQKRAAQAANDASNDLAKAEKRARERFSAFASKAAHADPAKGLASAIQTAGVAQDAIVSLEKAVQAVQDTWDKSSGLWQQLKECGQTQDVAACAEPILDAYKQLYKPLADAAIDNSCTWDEQYATFSRGPPAWSTSAGSPVWDSKVAANAFLAVFPGGQGMAVRMITAELKKQGENLEGAFKNLQKSAVAWGNQQVKSFSDVLADLAQQAMTGNIEAPKFDIPALDIKFSVIRSNCVNRLKIKGYENVKANAEGNYRWILGWRFKGGFDATGKAAECSVLQACTKPGTTCKDKTGAACPLLAFGQCACM